MLARLRKLQGDEGFTLIELLIVIVILGILAAVVVFAVGGITNNGTLSACKSDKTSVATAAEAYFAQNAVNPPNMAALVPGFLHSAPTANGITLTPGTTSVTTTLTGC
jgi:general secretion pathway protein G